MEDRWAPRKGVTSPIRQLVLSADKERSELGDYRVKRCEALLRAKEEEVVVANRKLAKLQEDFEYHLQLLTERDMELAKFEEKVAELQNTPGARDPRRSTSNIAFTARPGSTATPPPKTATLERTVQDLTHRLQVAEEDQGSVGKIVEAALEHETRRFEKQLQRQLEAKDQQGEARRTELSTAYEGLLKQQKAETEARLSRQQTEAQERWLKVERELQAALAQADSEAKKASDCAYELARTREQLAEAAAAASFASKALEDEKRTGADRLDRERKGSMDVQTGLEAEYEQKSAEMLASVRAVEQAFQKEKGEYQAENNRLQAEVEDRRLQAQAMEVRLEVAAVRGGSPESVAGIRKQGGKTAEDRARSTGGRANQELEILKQELAALRSDKSARKVGELEGEVSKLRKLVGCGWLAASLAEGYLAVDSQHAGKPCRSIVKRMRHQMEDVGRSQAETDASLGEDKRLMDQELMRLRELRELVKAGGKGDGEDGSTGDVEEDAIKHTGPTRRASSGSMNVNVRPGEKVTRSAGGEAKHSKSRTGRAYREGSDDLTVHLRGDERTQRKAPATRTAVDQLFGRGNDVQDKKIDVAHAASGNGTPNLFAKGGSASKVETTWAEIRVISKHDVEIAGAKAIEEKLAPKLASMEKVMNQIVSYEKLRAERRKRNAKAATEAEKEVGEKEDPLQDGRVAPEQRGLLAKGREFPLEREDTEIYYREAAAAKARSGRNSRPGSAARTEQAPPALPPWLIPEPKADVIDSPGGTLPVASEASFESSVRSWISGAERNGANARSAGMERNVGIETNGETEQTDDALITTGSDGEGDDSRYGQEQTLAAAFQAYKHKYGQQNRKVSRAASTGKVTPVMTASKGLAEVTKRRHQSVSHSASDKGPSMLGSPERAAKGPAWRTSYKGITGSSR